MVRKRKPTEEFQISKGRSGWCLTNYHKDCPNNFIYSECVCECHLENAPADTPPPATTTARSSRASGRKGRTADADATDTEKPISRTAGRAKRS
jgi:hypothetical protein